MLLGRSLLGSFFIIGFQIHIPGLNQVPDFYLQRCPNEDPRWRLREPCRHSGSQGRSFSWGWVASKRLSSRDRASNWSTRCTCKEFWLDFKRFSSLCFAAPDAAPLMEWVEHGVAEVVSARIANVAIVARSTNPLWPNHDDDDIGHLTCFL